MKNFGNILKGIAIFIGVFIFPPFVVIVVGGLTAWIVGLLYAAFIFCFFREVIHDWKSAQKKKAQQEWGRFQNRKDSDEHRYVWLVCFFPYMQNPLLQQVEELVGKNSQFSSDAYSSDSYPYTGYDKNGFPRDWKTGRLFAWHSEEAAVKWMTKEIETLPPGSGTPNPPPYVRKVVHNLEIHITREEIESRPDPTWDEFQTIATKVTRGQIKF